MRILVINPNSTQAVTDGISHAVQNYRVVGGPGIDCLTLSNGPAGIESDADVADAAIRVAHHVQKDSADAYVVACFSDPGVAEAKALSSKPIYGIAESAYLTALTEGTRFGVISILETSIRRHMRHIDQLGLRSHLAGDRALGMGVKALGDAEKAMAVMTEVAFDLIEKDGADVLILGCAGMAAQRASLEARIKVPVIEPCQAATGMALSRLLLAHQPY